VSPDAVTRKVISAGTLSVSSCTAARIDVPKALIRARPATASMRMGDARVTSTVAMPARSAKAT